MKRPFWVDDLWCLAVSIRSVGNWARPLDVVVVLCWLNAQWVARFRGSPPHDYVLFHPQKIRERVKDFRTAFRRARERAGIPWLRSYDLRHYFISKAIMAGVDYLTIMKWCGHASSQMIDKVYGHLQPGHSTRKILTVDFGLPKEAGKDRSGAKPLDVDSYKVPVETQKTQELVENEG